MISSCWLAERHPESCSRVNRRRVPVYYAGLQTPWSWNASVQFSLGVLTADINGQEASAEVDWSSLRAAMQPSNINPAAWSAIWDNFISRNGTTWTDYVRMLDRASAYLGRQGVQVKDINQILTFEFLIADGLYPSGVLATGRDAGIEAPGSSLTFTRSFGATISSRYSSGILGWGLVS